jgi:diguanylate cyclase (GGDEF)-like protein/PAS domain S-box-containing protein
VPASGWSRVAVGESRALHVGVFAGFVLSAVMILLGIALRRGDLKNAALNREMEVRKAAEDGLRAASTVFSSSGEAIIIMDSDFQVLSVNPAFSEISGYTPEDVLGQVPQFLDQTVNAEISPMGVMASLKNTGQWRGEILSQRKNGETYPTWVTINSVASENGSRGRYVAVCSDISMIQQSQQELERIAHYDVLTALPNRLLFRKRLGQDIASASSSGGFVVLMLLDVDGFKGVNDSFGHQVGDRLLREVGDRLLHCLGNRDTAARLGGDEFAVILTGLSGREEAIAIASRILRELRQPFHVEEVVVHLTVSIGIACCPDDGVDEVVLTRNADAAMYAAKEAGRNVFRFYQWEMTRAVRDALLMEQRMRLGLDQGQFEVWFQPQVSLATGKVIGAEGLVRWRDPEHGMVSPAQFVPLAERSDLIHKLGDIVIQQVLGHAERWQSSGLEFGKLSINVATPQIERGDLVASLQRFLRDTQVPASALEIEVTESLFMTDAARARNTLNEIRALGLSIAVDDFGTGYSSLAYLKTLPINHLKIDRAFIKDLPSAQNDEAIVRAIISMGRSLGFRLTAEGVETEEQMEFLKREGCHVIQGYYYFKPMPAQDFERLLRESARVAADASG